MVHPDVILVDNGSNEAVISVENKSPHLVSIYVHHFNAGLSVSIEDTITTPADDIPGTIALLGPSQIIRVNICAPTGLARYALLPYRPFATLLRSPCNRLHSSINLC